MAGNEIDPWLGRAATDADYEKASLFTNLMHTAKEVQHRGSKHRLNCMETEVLVLCQQLEAVFAYGLRSKNVLRAYEESTCSDTLNRIKKMKQARTATGQGRAWSLCALEEGALASHLIIMMEDKKRLTSTYTSDSFLIDPEYSLMVTTVMEGLGAVQVTDNFDDVNFDELHEEVVRWTPADLDIPIAPGGDFSDTDESGEDTDDSDDSYIVDEPSGGHFFGSPKITVQRAEGLTAVGDTSGVVVAYPPSPHTPSLPISVPIEDPVVEERAGSPHTGSGSAGYVPRGKPMRRRSKRLASIEGQDGDSESKDKDSVATTNTGSDKLDFKPWLIGADTSATSLLSEGSYNERALLDLVMRPLSQSDIPMSPSPASQLFFQDHNQAMTSTIPMSFSNATSTSVSHEEMAELDYSSILSASYGSRPNYHRTNSIPNIDPRPALPGYSVGSYGATPGSLPVGWSPLTMAAPDLLPHEVKIDNNTTLLLAVSVLKSDKENAVRLIRLKQADVQKDGRPGASRACVIRSGYLLLTTRHIYLLNALPTAENPAAKGVSLVRYMRDLTAVMRLVKGLFGQTLRVEFSTGDTPLVLLTGDFATTAALCHDLQALYPAARYGSQLLMEDRDQALRDALLVLQNRLSVHTPPGMPLLPDATVTAYRAISSIVPGMAPSPHMADVLFYVQASWKPGEQTSPSPGHRSQSLHPMDSCSPNHRRPSAGASNPAMVQLMQMLQINGNDWWTLVTDPARQWLQGTLLYLGHVLKVRRWKQNTFHLHTGGLFFHYRTVTDNVPRATLTVKGVSRPPELEWRAGLFCFKVSFEDSNPYTLATASSRKSRHWMGALSLAVRNPLQGGGLNFVADGPCWYIADTLTHDQALKGPFNAHFFLLSDCIIVGSRREASSKDKEEPTNELPRFDLLCVLPLKEMKTGPRDRANPDLLSLRHSPQQVEVVIDPQVCPEDMLLAEGGVDISSAIIDHLGRTVPSNAHSMARTSSDFKNPMSTGSLGGQRISSRPVSIVVTSDHVSACSENFLSTSASHRLHIKAVRPLVDLHKVVLQGDICTLTFHQSRQAKAFLPLPDQPDSSSPSWVVHCVTRQSVQCLHAVLLRYARGNM